MLLPVTIVSAQDSTGVTVRVVQRGETLYSIAQEFSISVEELARMNGIADPGTLQVGQRLLVPTGEGVDGVLHLVQPGESLRSIAALYAVDPFTLGEANGVNTANPLYVGQVLTVIIPPEAAATPSDQGILSPTATAESVGSPSGVQIHTVAPGETLFRIATGYNLTSAEVAAANGITNPEVIYAGQQLIIPNVDPPQLALDLPAPIEAVSLQPLVLTEGRTGAFRLDSAAPVEVSATFLSRSIPALAQADGSYVLLMSVPIFTEAGVYPLELTVTDSDGVQTPLTVNIQVLGGSYRQESITLSGDRLSLLDPAVETAEQQILRSVTSGFSPTSFFQGTLSLPAAAAMSSPFGSRRSFNGSAFDRFHSGADFAGAVGTPVLAPASGSVVLADTLNICGVTTVIDHGWGIFTVYCHQSEQYVQPGDFVTTGQVIGTIGLTGRATGAHLHWELWVNGVAVDPMQWVRQAFF